VLLPLLLACTRLPNIVSLSNAPQAIEQAHVDALWEFVQTIGGRKVPPPLVYFTREDEPPASPPFLAYYYEHTRVLRISREAITPRRLATGYVYLILGHEMLHYAWADRRPVEEHHCLFAREGFEERIADFVVVHDIGHPFLRAVHLQDTCDGEDQSRNEPTHTASTRQSN
jgi:hypothetical protein